MVTLDQAIDKVRENLPYGKINAFIEWEDKYLFSVYTEDPDEGELDPFYAVNKETGLFSGFSIVGDEDTSGVLAAFEAKLQHENLSISFLAHYGVKGMKWGVRKNDKPSTASVATELGLNILKPSVGRLVPRVSPMAYAINIGMNAANKVNKDVILKATFASPYAIAGYAVTALDTGAYRVPAVAAQNIVRGGWKKKPALANQNLDAAGIKKTVVKGINKQFPGLGTTNNCLRCTYAYEMRRRGYDVAATKTMLASGQSFIGSHVMTKSLRKVNRIRPEQPKDIKGHRAKPTSADVFRELSKEPNRSRGDLQMSWGPLMGGHSVAYEIVNGKPVIFDTQSGKVYSTPKELNKLTKMATSFKYNRLDNKNLNTTGITAWVKDTK